MNGSVTLETRHKYAGAPGKLQRHFRTARPVSLSPERPALHFKLNITLLLIQCRHFNCSNLTLQLHKSVQHYYILCVELHIKKLHWCGSKIGFIYIRIKSARNYRDDLFLSSQRYNHFSSLGHAENTPVTTGFC